MATLKWNDLKNEDDLKNGNNLKNEDNLNNENNLKKEDNIKTKTTSKWWWPQKGRQPHFEDCARPELTQP